MKILMEGHGSRNGICERFTKRNETDRNHHPIPLLANGPGTGKSRFLQEIPTLLREQIENYRMYAVNVTFGNGTPAKSVDVPIDETSVALRILYEHFISGGTYDYEKFVRMCGENYKITISGALDVVLKDIDTDISMIILGIDELNNLHKLYTEFKSTKSTGTIQGPLEEMFKGSTYRYLPLRLLQSQEVQ
ncbi:8654_t:CDS:2, partial [Funneliformis mosseae]